MKKKWKALTAVCCAAVLTLSLTACSGSNTGSDSSAGTAAAGTTGEEASASSGRTDLRASLLAQ